MSEKTQAQLYGLAFSLLCVFMIFRGCQIGKRAEVKSAKPETSEISRIRDEKNRETAKREALEAEVSDLRSFKASADPELRRLSELAEKYRNQLRAGAALSIETKAPAIKAPAVITVNGKAPADSISEIRISANFEDSTGARWFSARGSGYYSGGSAIMRLDSLRVRNEVSVALVKEDFGFMKLKRRSIVEVSLGNPYSTVKNIQAVQAPERKPNRAAWIGAGAVGALLVKIALGIVLK